MMCKLKCSFSNFGIVVQKILNTSLLFSYLKSVLTFNFNSTERISIQYFIMKLVNLSELFRILSAHNFRIKLII